MLVNPVLGELLLYIYSRSQYCSEEQYSLRFEATEIAM